MAEKFDIYTIKKEKTGRVGTRGLPLLDGDYRFVVRVVLCNKKGNQLLIQQRAANTSSWPNYWDFTAGGGVLAGENLKETAEREVFEEIGLELDLAAVKSQLTVAFEEGWEEVFFVRTDVDLTALTLQKEEVATVKWATQAEIQALLNEEIFIPRVYAAHIFDYIEFYEK